MSCTFYNLPQGDKIMIESNCLNFCGINKDKPIIKNGVYEPLSKIPFHKMTSIVNRLILSNNKLFPELNQHIAVHYVNTAKNINIEDYVEPHIHQTQEINIILSDHHEGLTYEITLDLEKHIVSSPVIIMIPKFVKHSAKAIKGRGIYICIINENQYSVSN